MSKASRWFLFYWSCNIFLQNDNKHVYFWKNFTKSLLRGFSDKIYMPLGRITSFGITYLEVCSFLFFMTFIYIYIFSRGVDSRICGKGEWRRKSIYS